MLTKSHAITRRVFKEPYPFEIYQPEGPGPFPVIFQTPILGRFIILEDLFFERRFARFFAEQGFACVLMDRPIFEFNPSRGIEQIQAYLEDSLKRNEAIFKQALQEPSLNPEKIGCFGMSFGAIINILWAAREKRLSANVFCMPGGNLPEIFMTSQDPLMISYRNAALACCHSDPLILKQSLQKIFTLDPLTAASALSKDQTLLILGLLDRVVPFRYGKELRDKMNFPKTYFLPFGHYFSILASPVVKWLVVRFLKKKLS